MTTAQRKKIREAVKLLEAADDIIDKLPVSAKPRNDVRSAIQHLSWYDR